MILCVNPNAAIDKTVVVENFHLDAIHRPGFELALPGGKGCNVARAARTLGCEVRVTGWVGGFAGQFIESELQVEGIQASFIHTKVESRTCLSILDPRNHTTTEIYEKGRPVSEVELETFYDLFREQLTQVSLVTLSGSLPPGVPADFYAVLIRMAHVAGVPILLDSSGEALRAGIEQGRPDWVKCNRAELSELVGQPLSALDQVCQAAEFLANQWSTRSAITLGSAGAVAAAGGRVWLVQSPPIQVVSAVGSGDAFLAGLAAGLLEERAVEDCLRLAVACGSANALQLGAGRLSLPDVQALLGEVRVASEAEEQPK